MKFSRVVALSFALCVSARPMGRIQANGGSSSIAIRAGGVNNAAAGGKGTAAKSSSSASATGTKAAASGAGGGGGDAQSSLTLDPSVLAKGFEQDGQATKEAGQVASLTSKNNFINFCATTKQPITNGQQVKGGSCNPAPMGSIPSTDNMPSAKFNFPKNMDTVQANKAFTVEMNIQGMETGNFVNAQQNYFAAPQQLNAKGQIVGHSHIVIEAIDSLTQTTPTDPKKFAFFLGLNAAAQNGVLTAAVTKGLPAGTYRMGSINTAANHQPCVVPVAQHGMLDDAVYFTVTGNGKAAAGAGAASNSTAAAGGATAGTKSTGGKKAAGAGNGNAAAGAASNVAGGGKAGTKSTGGQKAPGAGNGNAAAGATSKVAAAAGGAKAGTKSTGGQKAPGAAGAGAAQKSGGKNRRWA